MSRRYEETIFNEVTREVGYVATWSFAVYPGDNDHFTICRDGVVKTVKVVDSPYFVYDLQKTQVKAIGGAAGLYNFVDDALFNGFKTCLAWKVLHHCFFNCKAAR